jgi:hypothetical protein
MAVIQFQFFSGAAPYMAKQPPGKNSAKLQPVSEGYFLSDDVGF